MSQNFRSSIKLSIKMASSKSSLLQHCELSKMLIYELEINVFNNEFSFLPLCAQIVNNGRM